MPDRHDIPIESDGIETAIRECETALARLRQEADRLDPWPMSPPPPTRVVVPLGGVVLDAEGVAAIRRLLKLAARYTYGASYCCGQVYPHHRAGCLVAEVERLLPPQDTTHP